MASKRLLRLEPLASLRPLIGSSKIVAFGVGPDGTVYVVTAIRELDYQRLRGAAGAAPTTSDRPRRYRVLGLSGAETVLDVLIEGEAFEIHHVQPLLDELLLVGSRSIFRSRDDFERNGRVYSRTGRFVREMLLGDGIESVQTTSSGVIWTSFFDEGVFGNCGRTEPVGASGLVAWSHAGKKQYEFEPAAGLDWIHDCYALNVTSKEDVWLYYYSDFPLVHLHRRKIVAFWNVPIAGSHAFAIDQEHALFCGGYRESDRYHLLSLEDGGAVNVLATIRLEDRNGKALSVSRAVGRGDSLYLLSEEQFLYRVDVLTAMDG